MAGGGAGVSRAEEHVPAGGVTQETPGKGWVQVSQQTGGRRHCC